MSIGLGFEFENNRFGEAQAAFAGCLMADLPGNADFSAFERAALRLSEVLVRRHLESAMQAAADARAREMSVDGVRYRQHALGVGPDRKPSSFYRRAACRCVRHQPRARARQQRPTLNVGVVQDGASELWTRIRAALFDEFEFKGRRWGVHLWKRIPWRETIDWYHLMGHLYAALQVLVKDKSKQQEMLNSWKSLLSRDNDGIKTIAKWLKNEASGTSREVWWKVQNVLNYVSVPHYFRYASLNTLGLHKGSGVTEGACKSLIAKRTKRSGQRFRPRGISAVLAVRSLLDSDRLPRFWEIFTQRYVAQCCAA